MEPKRENSIFNATVAGAISKLRLRSESTDTWAKAMPGNAIPTPTPTGNATRQPAAVSSSVLSSSLVQSFVAIPGVRLLENDNDQVLFGRRGTGKTHTFRYLKNVVESKGDAVAYIDLRLLGDNRVIANSEMPMGERCLALFRDLALELLYQLEVRYLGSPPPNSTPENAIAFDGAVRGARHSVASGNSWINPDAFKFERNESSTTDSKMVAKNALPIPMLDLEASVRDQTSELKSVSGQIVDVSSLVVFPDVSSSLREVIGHGGRNVWLLLDEWSSLPIDVQPYLAEYLRRCTLPVPGLCVKIAAYEHQSQFSAPHNGSIIGLALGSELHVAQNLDDYFTMDLSEREVADHFATVLFRHLMSERVELSSYRAFKGSDLPALFSSNEDQETFRKIVLAAEGNVRDFLQLFTASFLDDYMRGRARLEPATVHSQCIAFASLNKLAGVPGSTGKLFTKLMSLCFLRKKSRSFMLPNDLDRNPALGILLDSRVLHVVQRSVVTPERIGAFFTRYTIDYGLSLAYLEIIDGLKLSREDQIYTEADQQIEDLFR